MEYQFARQQTFSKASATNMTTEAQTGLTTGEIKSVHRLSPAHFAAENQKKQTMKALHAQKVSGTTFMDVYTDATNIVSAFMTDGEELFATITPHKNASLKINGGNSMRKHCQIDILLSEIIISIEFLALGNEPETTPPYLLLAYVNHKYHFFKSTCVRELYSWLKTHLEDYRS